MKFFKTQSIQLLKRKKVVYLPLDERPCNSDFVSFLTENHKKIQLVSPPSSCLSDKKTPANFEKIKDFLLKECKDAEYFIGALDMLLYGGIVPSRLHYLDKETLKERLKLLSLLKKENPTLKIFMFGLVMRCPSYTSDEEEPDYYGTCGREIFLYGQNEHKYLEGCISKDEYLAEKEKLNVCERYLPDFLDRRACNISLFLDALALVGNIIDRFFILQDDSSSYGYTALDQQKVKQMISRLKLDIDIYPGADEGGMTLLSRVVTDIEGYSPKICPVYPDEKCKTVIPLFEDRAAYKSIEAQIRSAGGRVCNEEDEADILLFCNLPLENMKDVDNPYGAQYDARNLSAYVDKMAVALKKGKAVAVADVAYCNGGDAETMDMLAEQLDVFELAGYAGWNTSSNTLGTVICQSLLHYFYGNTAAHKKFTALRIYEDLAYCGWVRQNAYGFVGKMGYNGRELDGKRGTVAQRMKEELDTYMQEKYPDVFNRYKIVDCYMPWNRLFEIGLTIAER